MLFQPPARPVPSAIKEAPLVASSPKSPCETPSTAAPVSPSRYSQTWPPGSKVERLLDDVSDIWTRATVLASHDGDLYDLEYLDDGTVECAVEGDELRHIVGGASDFPDDLWEHAGCYLGSKEDLAAFERIARAPREAAVQCAQEWWCAAYHANFGRCTAACRFQAVLDESGWRLAAQEMARCSAVAAIDTKEKRALRVAGWSWKARFQERDRLQRLAKQVQANANAAKSGAGDARYFTASGLKVQGNLDGLLRFGGKRADHYFDPRLGFQVSSED